MQYIGKLDREKLGIYTDKISTDIVILTTERVEHIKQRHPNDSELYINYIPNVISDPDYILEDINNKDTIILLKTFTQDNNNLQIVVKLNTNKNELNKYNSILTFWHIRKRSYNSTLKNNKILYKCLDNSE